MQPAGLTFINAHRIDVCDSSHPDMPQAGGCTMTAVCASGPRTRVVILGAAGRDFHNFNVVYRDDPAYAVVAFTAAQIDDIAGRRYPHELRIPCIRMAFRSSRSAVWRRFAAAIASIRWCLPVALSHRRR
jgi:hypothetical protein